MGAVTYNLTGPLAGSLATPPSRRISTEIFKNLLKTLKCQHRKKQTTKKMQHQQARWEAPCFSVGGAAVAVVVLFV
jgi:hypothetical protein